MPSLIALSRATTPQSKPDSRIKNPRPDFTIGLSHPTVVIALMKHKVSENGANELLEHLQTGYNLSSDATRHSLNARFPIIVIEGKAYATGKTIFEAENQAAVSGSCMVNLQRQFSSVYDGILPSSERRMNARSGKTPLAFSICTQGPIIELWVHHSVLDSQGICRHYMNLLKACHASLADGLEDFLMLLGRLMIWYRTEFLADVVNKLVGLAKHFGFS